MTATSSVPDIEWTATGLVLPTEAAVLAGVQADYNAAFGGNLNPQPQTPQGQLESSTTAAIADKNAAIAQLVDQVDPDNATGFMQDAIGRIYFMNRKPGTATAVQLVCTGALGVTIPVGAEAQDTSGNIYLCTEAGQIDVSGTVTLPFANQVLGPIACPQNTVTKIYQAITGWDSVNNPSAGVEGSDVESAADFEFRRQNSVAANAHGSLPSIYAEVFEVANVIDCYVDENVTDDPIEVGSSNYTLVPHSFYVGVVGGAAADIAQAIWTKKNEGSNMNGNTTQVVTDDSGYSYPYPTYPITFNNCAENPAVINFIISIVNSSALPSTIVADVQAAVTAQFNGTNGGQRARIGALLLAASYYGPVATCEGPAVPVQVLQILIGVAFTGQGSVTDGSDVLVISTVTTGSVSIGNVISATDVPSGTAIVQQLAQSFEGTGSVTNTSTTLTIDTVTDGELAPGSVVTMANVPTGTKISSQLSGTTGGVGTYALSAAATGTTSGTAPVTAVCTPGGIGWYQMSAQATGTAGPEAVTMAGGTAAQIGIDQAPTLGNIAVTLV